MPQHRNLTYHLPKIPYHLNFPLLLLSCVFLLLDHIVCKITHKKNIRSANTCDSALKLLKEGITPDIQKHKQNLWKEHSDAHWDHRHKASILWKTIDGLPNRVRTPTLNTSITFNNKITSTPKHIANCFTKQFTNTQHIRQPDPLTEQHIKYNDVTSRSPQLRSKRQCNKVKITTYKVNKLNIRHLKYIGPLRFVLLTSMLKMLLAPR